MLYVPIHIVHIKRYLLLDKFQIEIRKNGMENSVSQLLLYQRLC